MTDQSTNTPITYSAGVVTTAMCISEYRADCDEGSCFNIFIEDYVDQFGSWELRSLLLEFTVATEAAYEKLGTDKIDRFTSNVLDIPCWDFGFIPWVCEKAAKDNDLKVSSETIIDWVETALAKLK
jgi:hypothetical protein